MIKCKITQKGNVALYPDKELVEKIKDMALSARAVSLAKICKTSKGDRGLDTHNK